MMHNVNIKVTETSEGIGYHMSADIKMAILPIGVDSYKSPIGFFKDVRQEADGSWSAVPVFTFKRKRFDRLRNWWRYAFWCEVKTRVRVLFYGLPENDYFD